MGRACRHVLMQRHVVRDAFVWLYVLSLKCSMSSFCMLLHPNITCCMRLVRGRGVTMLHWFSALLCSESPLLLTCVVIPKKRSHTQKIPSQLTRVQCEWCLFMAGMFTTRPHSCVCCHRRIITVLRRVYDRTYV